MARIGVLALQGAFREHAAALRRLGADVCEVRQLKDMEGLEGMVIPGGESTTIGKLLVEWDMLEPLRRRILDVMPVYGSCAGLILLCKEIEGSDQPRLGVLDATVRRNAFGRQVDSFETDLHIDGLAGEPLRAVFIRAPLISRVGEGVQVLARLDADRGERIVAVRQGNVLATSFHPELTPDLRLHQYFLDMLARSAPSAEKTKSPARNSCSRGALFFIPGSSLIFPSARPYRPPIPHSAHGSCSRRPSCPCSAWPPPASHAARRAH